MTADISLRHCDRRRWIIFIFIWLRENKLKLKYIKGVYKEVFAKIEIKAQASQHDKIVLLVGFRNRKINNIMILRALG